MNQRPPCPQAAAGRRPVIGGRRLLPAGHNHVYERFAPQTPAGRRDAARGIREMVVGTGGAARYPFGGIAANSERRDRPLPLSR